MVGTGSAGAESAPVVIEQRMFSHDLQLVCARRGWVWGSGVDCWWWGGQCGKSVGSGKAGLQGEGRGSALDHPVRSLWERKSAHSDRVALTNSLPRWVLGGCSTRGSALTSGSYSGKLYRHPSFTAATFILWETIFECFFVVCFFEKVFFP